MQPRKVGEFVNKCITVISFQTSFPYKPPPILEANIPPILFLPPPPTHLFILQDFEDTTSYSWSYMRLTILLHLD